MKFMVRTRRERRDTRPPGLFSKHEKSVLMRKEMKKAKTNRKSLIESEMKRKKRRKIHNEIASEFQARRSREDEEMHEIVMD